MKILPFNEIIGNYPIRRLLQRAAFSGRLPHSMIFSGIEGIGKKLTAASLIAYINCSNKTEDTICGKCSSCKLLNIGNHPDMHMVTLDEGKKEIGIDSIRNLIRDIQKRPFIASSKAVIIDGAELMTTEASNAVLKTLEEPPGESFIFLITENLSSLLPTIRSRSQVFRFGPISIGNIQKFIEDKTGSTLEAARLVAQMSNGSLLKALQFQENSKDCQDITIKRIAGIFIERDLVSGMEISSALSSNRKEFDTILCSCYSILRDLLCIKVNGEKNHIVNLKYFEILQSIAGMIDISKLIGMLEDFDRWTDVNRKNLNLKLNAEDFVIKLQSIAFNYR